MEHGMFLSYKYELVRANDFKVGVYICQNEKNEQMRSGSLCKRN